MKRDFLTGLGLESETVEKIMAEHGKAVNEYKDKADNVDNKDKQIKDLENQIEDRDKQLADLQKQAEGNEDLQQKIQDLQKENKDTKEQHKQELEQQKKESKLEVALKDAGAKNPKAVKALLNEEAVSLDGDNLLGLDEQLKNLQESDGYLFGEEKPAGVEGRTPHKTGDATGQYTGKNPFQKDTINLTEQARLMKEEPDLAKQLQAQAKG